MYLFVNESFVSHSGNQLSFKLECDAIKDKEWEAIAHIAVSKLPCFKTVFGIPSGGIKLANALLEYRDEESRNILIVDDVLTTGNSMEKFRNEWKTVFTQHRIIGFVLFARGPCPNWVIPFLTVHSRWQ